MKKHHVDIHSREYVTKIIDKSTKIAAKILEKRLDSMNEFRQALEDQSRHFLTKEHYQIQHERLVEDIRMLRENKATLEGRASIKSVLVAYVISILGLIIGACSLLLYFL